MNVTKYLYIANSTKDIYSVNYTNRAAAVLEETKPENLTWEYKLFNKEIHESLAYLSLYHGLKYYYHNFASLTFGGVDEFYSLRGMPYVKQYFKERGERFGLPTAIDEGTKNTLIWLAWKRNEFEAFDLFMTEFADVLETKRYASAYWQNRLAQFYLKHEAYEDAIIFFDRGINEYANANFMAKMCSGSGEAYLGLNQKKKAKIQVKQAIKAARQNDDRDLSSYQEQLTKLD